MAMFTTKELMDIILLDDKWWLGYCNGPTARTIRHRHNKGILTDETYEKLFFHFGYKKHTTWSNGAHL